MNMVTCAKSLSPTLTCTHTFALDPQAPSVENGYVKGTVGKGAVSKMALVPFTCSLIIKSRGEKTSLQNNLKAHKKWHGSEKDASP